MGAIRAQRTNVRFGSLADVTTLNWDVCFTPESGLQIVPPTCPLSANSDKIAMSVTRRLYPNAAVEITEVAH
jgi:hypothetical protein